MVKFQKAIISDLQNRINKLQDENNRLIKTNNKLIQENMNLKSLLNKITSSKEPEKDDFKLKSILVNEENKGVKFLLQSIDKQQIIKDRISLFRNLFRGREDVYPLRWESQSGNSGYSPACKYEWVKPICNKPKIKCSECEYREYLPLTDQVIYDHLSGKHAIGVYPLLKNDTCWFLAIDFDKSQWQDDCLAFIETCEEMNVPASLERSRSGNGAHVWIFFEEPVLASLARKLGGSLLTRAMNNRHQIGLNSYDRLFPNQDTLPKGGFGNLIALPLQGTSRKNGNTVFTDRTFTPYEDQWNYLSQVKKFTKEELRKFLQQSRKTDNIIELSLTSNNRDQREPWNLFSQIQEKEKTPFKNSDQLKVKLIKSNLIYIDKKDLSSKIINQIIRLAAFPNPEFYKAQSKRLPTYDKPRMITCFEEFAEYITLPRGCFEDLIDILNKYNCNLEIRDEQFPGYTLKTINFMGTLTPLQEDAQEKLLNYDHGILSATTAFGKTVVAASIIAKRQVNSLVIVNRTQLIDQWKEKLSLFLDVSQSDIGQIGGGKNKRTGIIDIATIQSLNQKGKVKELVTEYGQVIVDECHHISAFSFEQVLKQVKSKYILGLTATPKRKDGHHPIMTMQCGPIRYIVDAKSLSKIRSFEQFVIPRKTSFKILNHADITIQDIYQFLNDEEERNDQIFNDLLLSLEEGRSPLLLTERTAHLEYFQKKLKGFAKNVIVLHGGMGKKQRQEIYKKMTSIADDEERVIIATGKYIGEGFDDARLDTLFLTMPISWKGTLQQYAGRLHRLHANKKTVKIYDYVDVHVPMLERMYEKRKEGYKAMGYKIIEE